MYTIDNIFPDRSGDVLNELDVLNTPLGSTQPLNKNHDKSFKRLPIDLRIRQPNNMHTVFCALLCLQYRDLMKHKSCA